jgi:hypothetical protein
MTVSAVPVTVHRRSRARVTLTARPPTPTHPTTVAVDVALEAAGGWRRQLEVSSGAQLLEALAADFARLDESLWSGR